MLRSILIAMSVCFAFLLCLAIGTPIVSSETDVVNHLSSSAIEKQVGTVERERERLMAVLLRGLASDEHQVQCSAVYLLGFCQYGDAVFPLARHITLEHVALYPQKAENRWHRWPTVEALIRIGKPSVRAMLTNLETSDDPHVRGLSARVIYYVEGPACAKCVLDEAIAKQTDRMRRERLEAAIPLLKGGEYKKP